MSSISYRNVLVAIVGGVQPVLAGCPEVQDPCRAFR